MAASTEGMMRLSDDSSTLIKTNNSAIKDGTFTILDSVTQIGNFAFSGCTSLTSITIPNSVQQISDLAFSGCTSLTSIIIPNSVTQIGNFAFGVCTSLSQIIIDSDDDNEIARITALLPEEIRSKVITEHQVANHFRPDDGGWAIHSCFWQAAKAAAKLGIKDIADAKITDVSTEAIEAASQFT